MAICIVAIRYISFWDTVNPSMLVISGTFFFSRLRIGKLTEFLKKQVKWRNEANGPLVSCQWLLKINYKWEVAKSILSPAIDCIKYLKRRKYNIKFCFTLVFILIIFSWFIYPKSIFSDLLSHQPNGSKQCVPWHLILQQCYISSKSVEEYVFGNQTVTYKTNGNVSVSTKICISYNFLGWNILLFAKNSRMTNRL